MTDPVECDDMTDVQEPADSDRTLHSCEDMTEHGHNHTCDKIDPAELRNKILEAFKAQGFEIAPDEAEIL